MAKHLIFITGGTGFIGSHVVAATLKAGHRARLSVRRVAQIPEVKARFASYVDLLEFVVIPDISKSEAFQAALYGVDYVFHLASPMPGKGSDILTGYINPAVQGTEAVLVAAAGAPSVKRVVIVSSILALMPMGGLSIPGLEVKEGSNVSIPIDLNMPFPEGFIGHGMKYQASKVLAHRATLTWMANHKPHFTLVTLHPTFVIGRDMTQTDATPGGINALFMLSLTSEKPAIASTIVDVRDVADAHLRALDAPVNAEGVTEVLLSGKLFKWEDVVPFIKERYPEFPIKLVGPFDEPFRVDTTRAEKDLGMSWREMEDTVGSMLDQQLELQGNKAGL